MSVVSTDVRVPIDGEMFLGLHNALDLDVDHGWLDLKIGMITYEPRFVCPEVVNMAVLAMLLTKACEGCGAGKLVAFVPAPLGSQVARARSNKATLCSCLPSTKASEPPCGISPTRSCGGCTNDLLPARALNFFKVHALRHASSTNCLPRNATTGSNLKCCMHRLTARSGATRHAFGAFCAHTHTTAIQPTHKST